LFNVENVSYVLAFLIKASSGMSIRNKTGKLFTCKKTN